MRILGIDPGTAIIGYGVIELLYGQYRLIDYGCIRTPAHTPMPERLHLIYQAMGCLLEKYQPDEVAMEELFFNRNITTAITVAQARGVLLLAAAQKGQPIGEYTPLQVKQAISGYGRAEKKQVQYMVCRILNLLEAPKPDDAADALAVAICHGNWRKLRNLTQEK